MTGGRPRTAISTDGDINARPRGARFVAETRYRDLDGRLRKVNATATSRAAIRTLLKERLLTRPGYGSGGRLTLASPFRDLVELWLTDLELRDLTGGTRENYRDDLRVHVTPVLEYYTLGEITTGRVELFLKREAGISYSRAKHSRTPAEAAVRVRPPPRRDPQGSRRGHLTAEEARPAAARPDPRADHRHPHRRGRLAHVAQGGEAQARPAGPQITEVLLGAALRMGEALALRVRDIEETPSGMVVHVRGTVVLRTGDGAARQNQPETEASICSIAVPDSAAMTLRARLAALGPGEEDRTVFANRVAGPLSPFNVRRTFRDFLALAGLAGSGVSLRWYRRTGATNTARGGRRGRSDHPGFPSRLNHMRDMASHSPCS